MTPLTPPLHPSALLGVLARQTFPLIIERAAPGPTWSGRWGTLWREVSDADGSGRVTHQVLDLLPLSEGLLVWAWFDYARGWRC